MNPHGSRLDERRCLQLAALLVIALLAPAARAAWFEDYQPTVEVAAPYVDLHTGPGRGFPAFHSATQGEQLQLLKRRTGWVKVRAARGVEGWIPQAALRGTHGPDGGAPVIAERSLDQHAQRRWEFGVSAGDFEGASSLSAHAGFALTPNIMLLAEATQILGDYSDALMGSGNIVMVPFPEWRVSPFFRIGTGIIEIRPQTTIVDSEDRTDEIVNAGIGATLYLGDRFSMRAEYQRHTVLTSRDDNEEIDQWKAGFSVFF
jgi:hypothetical protein